jgi:glucan phosphoethanolaminetransferase (alkaline phosphatase superfamily)
MAHVDLAKAEATQIGMEAGKVGAAFGLALVLVLIAATLFVLGTSLFLAEWLLGSMGWGIVHGMEACIAVALSVILAALSIRAARIGAAIAIGIIVGVIVTLVLAFWIFNRLYDAIFQATNLNLDPASAPLVVGVVLWALIGAIAGIVLSARSMDTWGARIGTILGLAILGAIVGALTAITYNPQVAAGIGITVGYAVWIGVLAADVARTGIDVEAIKLRFTPTQSIETGKETLEWLQKRMPPGIG